MSQSKFHVLREEAKVKKKKMMMRRNFTSRNLKIFDTFRLAVCEKLDIEHVPVVVVAAAAVVVILLLPDITHATQYQT